MWTRFDNEFPSHVIETLLRKKYMFRIWEEEAAGDGYSRPLWLSSDYSSHKRCSVVVFDNGYVHDSIIRPDLQSAYGENKSICE